MRQLSIFTAAAVIACTPARAQALVESEHSFLQGQERIGVLVLSAAQGQVTVKARHARKLVGLKADATTLDALAASPEMRQIRQRQRYLFSGGFSAYNLELPDGLLIEAGQVRAPLDTSPSRIPEDSTCAGRTRSSFKLSGLLCIDTANAWSIVRTDDFKSGTCRDAIQAGPMLVEAPGTSGICSETAPAAIRMAACIGEDNRLHLVITRRGATLAAFADWLKAAPLKCQMALNLTGGAQAGRIRLPSRTNPLPRSVGGVNTPLASALLLEAQ